MSTTTHAPKQIDPSASLHAESLGLARSPGRLPPTTRWRRSHPKAAAGEEKGIRCNVIAPGFMDTPMGRDASRRRTDRAVTVPFGRQGTGWEVAYAALFLISNESSYVNAHTLFLDAGHMAGIVRS
ncbi:SDR family oxidoreductase [Bradyrhizobium sp. Ash2021]|uniref:SDR family oxidoreductase n=1 Tax=Bradyrhizobium sp. Ash2021 TaxID=2954771 RepID=UPI00281534CC|nr:SDR family oxidoreductase [Bradyrhizobium sp. Ash2021]WMT77128.1 SDR family oxidoreductase [Bradyrhizobium sp. Ash2021]